MVNKHEITSVSLDEFLSPISEALGRDFVPKEVVECDALNNIPTRVYAQNKEDLIGIFVDAAKKMFTHVHVCKKAEVAQNVVDIIKDVIPDSSGACGLTVLPNDDHVRVLGIQALLASNNLEYKSWDPSLGAQANCDMCLNAEYGLTFPRAAVAETGSIMQLSDANCGRSISLLPNTHIAVIDADDIVAHMKDALELIQDPNDKHGKSMPRQVCFISGPSVTSDIELVRVEGVHGPMSLHFIVFDV